MLQIENRTQLEYMCKRLGIVLDENFDMGSYPIRAIHIDVPIPFSTMAEIVDYLREEKEPFTVHWLMNNADFDKISKIENVDFTVEDDTLDGKDAGCIDIIYCAQYYWCLCKGTDGKEWLATASNEYRNDAWIPSVRTIADFKRLFHVATGYELPLKNVEEMTKIADDISSEACHHRWAYVEDLLEEYEQAWQDFQVEGNEIKEQVMTTPKKYRAKEEGSGKWVTGWYVELHSPHYDNDIPDRVVGYDIIPSIFNDEEGERSNSGYWHTIDRSTLEELKEVTT